MRRPFLLLAALLLAFGLPLAGCGKGDPHELGFANTHCPVQSGPVATDDPGLVVHYKGQKIGFCCAGCPQKFEREPERYMDMMRKDPARYGYRP